MKIATALIASSLSVSCLASSLLPIHFNQAGAFPVDRGKYELSISLDAETYSVTKFDLRVDGQVVPIPLRVLSDFDLLDLSSVRVVLARGEWIDTGSDLYVPPYAELSIEIRAVKESCKSKYTDVFIVVDTIDDNRWVIRDECREDDE